MDLEAHWRAMIRRRRVGKRPLAHPETARRFRQAIAARLAQADPDWWAKSNPAVAAMANRLELRAFEGRRWDARSVRGLRDAIQREETAERVRAQMGRDGDLRRATRLLSAMAEDGDLELIFKEYLFLSMVLMEDHRDEPALRLVVRRAEDYLASKGHPEAPLLRSMRDGL